jgi:hypothetical protein
MNQNRIKSAGWIKSAGVIWTMMAGLVFITASLAVTGKTASDSDVRSKKNIEKIIVLDKDISGMKKDITFIRDKLTAIDSAQAVENALTVQQTKLLSQIMQQLEENEAER